MKRLLLCLLLVSLPTLLSAKIYTWKNADGTISYSDQPQAGADEITLPAAQTYTPTAFSKTPPQPPAQKSDDTLTHYTGLSIIKPSHDSSIRENSGRVAIEVSLTPALAVTEGHYFTALIDGKVAVAATQSTQFAATEVDRGTHSLVIEVRQENGETLIRSSASTFHLLRMSTLFKKPAP